ncbi:MAG: BACON domain-containing protein [Odoribacter splanchnicus]
MKNKLVICMCIILLSYACNSNSGDEIPAFIEVGENCNLLFESIGGEDTLTINSSGVWEIEGETDWCYISRIPNTNPQQVILHVLSVKENKDRSASLLFKCGDRSVTVEVKQLGQVETGYIDLELEKPGVAVKYDKNTGVVTVDYTNKEPVMVRRGRVIVLPPEFGYEIRIVESSKVSGKNIVLQTAAGDMCDLFSNVDFTLTTDASVGGDAISPMEIGYLTPSGKYQPLDLTDKKASTFFAFKKNFDGDDIFSEGTNSISWKKCLLEAKLSGSLYFKFGEEKTNTGKKGVLEKFEIKVNGDLNTDYQLNYDFEQDVEKVLNETVNVSEVQNMVYRFMVGSIPVIILTDVHFYKQLNISAKSKMKADYACKMEGKMNAGFKWQRSKEAMVEYMYEPEFSLLSSQHKAEGSFSGRVSYYPVLEFSVYNYTGPWLKPYSYLREEVTSSVQKYDIDYYIWNADSWAGLDLQMGTELEFGVKKENVWSSECYNVCEEKVCEAPSKIELVSPSDTVYVTAGDAIRAVFSVKSYSPQKQQYEPCQGVLVAFEAESGLSHTIQMSDAKGEVSVLWTPENVDIPKLLQAGIVDQNRFYVDKVSLCAIKEMEMKPTGVVDLGLSVKWASCNLGANTPEEFGAAYAWGELVEKAEYTWKSYSFWKDDGDGEIVWEELENIGNIENTKYDVAKAKLGGNWRLPTSAEFDELIKKCEWEWVSQNGVTGRKVTGPNGNSIFLPATGQYTDEGLKLRGAQGFYWSGTLTTVFNNHNKADRLYFCSSFYRWQDDFRYYGGFIRPVCE